MSDPNLTWLILLLPLAASVITALLTLRNGAASGLISCGAIIVSFGLALGIFFSDIANQVVGADITWLAVGNFKVGFGLTLDPLSKLMMLIVTGVGSAIHVFSLGYMAEDPSKGRFFAKMSFFTFSMLGIVLASNFIQIFIFWELVGVSSYLLIGFWYERASAAEAAKKAFIVNRVGDFGFLLGILMVWLAVGSLEFQGISDLIGDHAEPITTMMLLLIFCGAVGKSAQVPLHVWLPDAMEGPTPVSALIHAATMVTAGVYMLCRVSFLFVFADDALNIIAWVGGITALLSALMSCVQNDIKRILAYSTLSQLGYMVMAVGLAGTSEAMFHLTTHAFFKALLFLAAGSIIVALHHEQDIWKMGGLRTRMTATFWAFTIGAAALAGFPMLSGFFSKDEILALAARENKLLFIVGLGTALLTAFYMTRLFFVAFFGPARGEAAGHAKESSLVMTVPLAGLAIFSLVGGYFGVRQYLGAEQAEHAPMWVGVVALIVSAVGFLFAWSLYGKTASGTETLNRRYPKLYALLAEKFYFDKAYDWLIANVQQLVAILCDGFDRWVIGGAGVRGLTRLAQLSGWSLRQVVQRGDLTTYAFVFAIGMVLIIYYVVIR